MYKTYIIAKKSVGNHIKQRKQPYFVAFDVWEGFLCSDIYTTSFIPAGVIYCRSIGHSIRSFLV